MTLALHYEKNMKLEEAKSMWRSVIRRHPEYWPGYEHLMRLFHKSGDADQVQMTKDTACSKVRRYSKTLDAGNCNLEDRMSARTFSTGITADIDADLAPAANGDANKQGSKRSEQFGPDIWNCLAFEAAKLWEETFCSNI